MLMSEFYPDDGLPQYKLCFPFYGLSISMIIINEIIKLITQLKK